MRKAILDVQFNGAPDPTTGRPTSTHHWVAYIGAKSLNDPAATHDWKKYGGVAAIPAGTKTIELEFEDYGPGKIWLDDVSARYTTAAQTDPLKN